MAVRRNIEPTPWATCRFEREAEESSHVPCVDCGGEVEDGGAVVLQGLAHCETCAMNAALSLRFQRDEWDELSDHDKTEVLEVLETGARSERTALVKVRRSGSGPAPTGPGGVVGGSVAPGPGPSAGGEA